MSHTETQVKVFARPAHDEREAFAHGLTAETPGYGKVQIVKSETTTNYADGDVRRKLDQVRTERVLFAMDADDAKHLAHTLLDAVVASVRPTTGGFR